MLTGAGCAAGERLTVFIEHVQVADERLQPAPIARGRVDTENEYERVVMEHQAFQGLLAQVSNPAEVPG